jgi:hypothetical protein
VQDNERLSRELVMAKQSAAVMQENLQRLKADNDRLKKEVQDTPLATALSLKDLSRNKTKVPIPMLDLGKVRKKEEKPGSDAVYVHKLEESIKLLNIRIKQLKDECRELAERNAALADANALLSQEADKAKPRPSLQARSSASVHALRIMTEPEPEPYRDRKPPLMHTIRPRRSSPKAPRGVVEKPKPRADKLGHTQPKQNDMPRVEAKKKEPPHPEDQKAATGQFMDDDLSFGELSSIVEPDLPPQPLTNEPGLFISS